MRTIKITAMEALILDGEYDEILVTGMGKSSGTQVQANKILIRGMMHFFNRPLVYADLVDCTGTCSFDSALRANRVKVPGLMNLAGILETKELDVSGVLNAQQITVAQKTEVGGMFKAASLKTGALSVGGTVQLLHTLECRTGNIEGVLKTGQLLADSLSCDGVVEVQGELHAGRIEADGVVKAKKIEGETISCDGMLKADTQISADRVTVEGIAQAEEIVGDYIFIDSRPNLPITRRKWFGKRGLVEEEKSRAQLIEATTIRLYNVKAAQVNGQDVHIGEGCEIGCLDCTGPVQIDSRAYVGKIVNNDKKI